MTQVFVIHGGTAFATYEQYLEYLKGKELDLVRLKGHDWKDALQENLGSEFEVYTPRMPNPQNAKYAEWSLWFEKIIPHMHDGVVLIGHSLGAIFLARYLSENKLPVKIAATLLVAPPYDTDEGQPLVEFTAPSSLTFLGQQGGRVVLYHSKDDPVVNFSESEKFRTQLPSIEFKEFTDRGHFNTEEFPEIVADIRSL